MNRKNASSSSPSSSRSAASSVDNESTVSDTFSLTPDSGYQSVIHKDDSVPSSQGPIRVPGKLIPRNTQERDNGGQYLEFEHRNGDNRLRNGDSQNATAQSHHLDGKRQSDNGNIQVDGADIPVHPGTGLVSPSEEKDHLTTHCEPVLTRPSVVQDLPHRKPVHAVSSENGLNETDSHGLVGEQELKLQMEAPIPVIEPGPERAPKRQLLATSSAPVRLARSELKALHHHQSDPEGHDDGSDGSSPLSSKSDMQSMSDYTGGATCGSERSLVRTKSMPSRSFSEVEEMSEYRRSNTQSGGRRMKTRNKENLNVRLVVPEKLSDRKKKKLMREIATIQQDGTVEFDVAGSARIASNLFGPGIFDEGGEVGEEEVADDDDDKELRNVPPLQIVMLIVGTRGDVQPFIAIGKHLQEYGHRVRLATHTNFREFVMTAGLEFYPLGGDPKVLAGYMVKNKGFLPSGPGEIQVQRKQIKAIINSLLPACVETDTESGSTVPFRAQAIIANPPAYGHVHVAEHLQVPLHIFFTMPWTATSQFPHPLSRVKSPAGYRMSYQVVDSLIWWGIRSMINDFRKKKLKLRPITYFSGSQGSIAELPTGYIWSPHLVPKPRDWGPLVDVVGFCFLNLAQDYKPPKDLMQWLKAGPAPIYIGFGSLPVVDPTGMTEIIVKALEATHQRGIIFKGWGGMGELQNVPDNIFLIEDCPHDWLFKQCAAVVHHGGAGTTAAGLKAACPTTVVPFFGDQPFWGEQIHAKGVGPPPIAVDQFSLDKLVKAIEFMLKDDVKQRATEIATAMENEDGVEGAVVAFHKHLPQDTPQLVNNAHPPDKGRFRMFKPLKNVYSCFL